jgi:hypothetical protein
MRVIIVFCIGLAFTSNIRSQNLSFSVGTDIPYQHFAGINIETNSVDVYYRTGILIPPYSDAILSLIQSFGTDEVYISLLDAAFDFGWMNSIGAYFKFGKQKDWYIGSEFRLDYLTAADTPKDLIETVTGQSTLIGNFMFNNVEINLGLRMTAVGLRFGKSFNMGDNNKHQLRTEISISKYVATQSYLKGNDQDLDLVNQKLDSLIWEDVFRPYGYVGGIGFVYTYKF